ncbi:MAG TPA: dihydrofolate reductase [Pirellulales bacterium]|nr:dihydrofolate reductase [Pirellulales bacterium]
MADVSKTKVSIIVAMSENRVIGRGGELPWHLSADLRRFKKITTGHSIIMGRKTYDSIGRPLPNRRSIVISRNRQYQPDGVEVVANFDRALKLCEGEQQVFVIGGSSIYELALPRADRLLVTLVHQSIEGDTLIPEYDDHDWQLVEDEGPIDDPQVPFQYSFRTYDRIRTTGKTDRSFNAQPQAPA